MISLSHTHEWWGELNMYGPSVLWTHAMQVESVFKIN